MNDIECIIDSHFGEIDYIICLMMKQYHLYVFTQEACPPCIRLKDHVSNVLTDNERAELDFVPLKTPSG